VGGEEEERISFALGRRENQGSLFRSGALLPTLADGSPARVVIHAPSSKNSRLIFAQQPRPNAKEILYTTSCGRRARDRL
jgi:hypothetical protein